GVAAGRVRAQALLRRGGGPEDDAPADVREARARHRRDPRAPAGGPRDRLRGAAAVADDRPPLAEGLDRAARGRREDDRGPLALTPGAVRGSRREPEAHHAAGGLAQELPG